ncbi:alpha/beta hydrolase [Sulfitobacter sp. D35]|uniref:alpha/beta hydrolase n=1 Tax=Sulfitobacter sp. D35 TaxID=3083252 RepID=UPI00296E78A6|nr:alpha/beta hydrolase [Sulfitobacter sp. D35]MDW4498599.1 alpha/beta hydrolase [Sulfitobacter sp. D35]
MSDLSRSVLISLISLMLLATGCARAPELIGVDNERFPVASIAELEKHRIFITTTRQGSAAVGALYSDRRSPEIGLSSVDVSVPPTHVQGVLERARHLPPDPRTEFAVVNPAIYTSRNAFVAALNRELDRRPRADREVLFFVHGYNTNTSDAVLRLAQFVEDTGFQGVPVLFTWASAARTTRYVYDLNSALIARSKLKEISEIIVSSRAESIGVFAHSMGTFLTMEGLVDAQLAGRLDSHDRIDHVILAAPDIDIDLFRTQVSILPPSLLRKMYLLVSKDDYALRISRRVAGGVPRVGASEAEELERLGLTVIDLSEIDDSSTDSHNKFAGSPEVVQLIGAGLRSNTQFSAGPTSALDDLLSNVPIQVFRP